MASAYSPTITNSSPYKPTFKLDFQCLKPPAPSDAIALGCAARFNLPAMDQAAMMDDHQFRGAPAMSWFLSPSYKVKLSEDREISDSDDDSLPSVREILAGLKQKEVIDLTAGDDYGGGDGDEKDVIEAASTLPTNQLRPSPSPLQNSPAQTAEDPVVAAFDVSTNSLGFSSANLKPPSEESRAPITEPLSVPAVHDASLTTPPRRTPFKNRPPWAIRKPVDEIMAPSDRHEALMRRTRDISNTAIAHSPLPEIADSIDGRVVDVFADDENGLVNNGQPPAKRPRRASSASSSVRPESLNRKEEMLDRHEWRAQHIVGERQTPSGLEYEVRVEKTVWLPRATLHTKLVRRYRAEQRAATSVRTRWSLRLQSAK